MSDRLVHHPETEDPHCGTVREVLGDDWQGWDGTDVEFLFWAADYGAIEVVERLVGRRNDHLPLIDPRHPIHTALRVARGWAGLDLETELRRRLGDESESATVRRDTAPASEFTHAERVRVTAADGTWAEALCTHLGIVTLLERRLLIPLSRDELLARALTDPDPGSATWTESWHGVHSLPDREATFDWAAMLLTHADREARLFGAEVVRTIGMQDVDGEQPGFDRALAPLRERLAAEQDGAVLSELIGAFDEYRAPGEELPELVTFARHAHPGVRRAVALGLAGSGRESLLAELAADDDASVRRMAVIVLRDHAPDSPVTAGALSARRDDPDPEVRLEALAGLARHGDKRAYRELQARNDTRHAYWLLHDVDRHLRQDGTVPSCP
ncbi:hypothetical protein GCM10010435_33430 [Winogradskya consettensis]|uniref:HEAT repeat domain-containing protein n=1 Tax=Winogradskya consettensis TaxID=113560 RepID=A0A919SCD0_9ACTN|nr:HEAT repeat domain-containing protein [Actinoplanes consettensis]GIM70020.1 hypothetical protein Aco04nite_18060 [Actinoplanes consettensis]